MDIIHVYPGGASSTLRLPGTLCNLVPYFTQVQYVIILPFILKTVTFATKTLPLVTIQPRTSNTARRTNAKVPRNSEESLLMQN